MLLLVSTSSANKLQNTGMFLFRCHWCFTLIKLKCTEEIDYLSLSCSIHFIEKCIWPCHCRLAKICFGAFKNYSTAGSPNIFFPLCHRNLICRMVATEGFHKHGPYCCNLIILLHRGLRTAMESREEQNALIKVWEGCNIVEEQKRETEVTF